MRSEGDRAIVARDRSLPGLELLLDPAQAAPLLSRVVPDATGTPETVYLRYKPGRSCLAGIRVPTGRGDVRVALKAYRRDDAALDGAVRAAAIDARLAITAHLFPDDPRLRGPRWLLNAATGAHAHARLRLPPLEHTTRQLLVWKPERRVVLRVDTDAGPVAVIKCHPESTFDSVQRVQAALGTGLPFRVPLVSRMSARRGVVVTPWIPGTQVTHQSGSLDTFREAGALLGRLHRAPLPDLIARPIDQERERLDRVAADIAALLPSAAGDISAIRGHLQRQWSAGTTSPVPVHGDFYVKQLLVSGGALACLDFDEAALGDAMHDIGVFLAHVELDTVRRVIDSARAESIREAFLSGYAGLPDASINAAVAQALLGLAAHPFRHRATDWPALTAAVLARTRQLLEPTAPVARGGGHQTSPNNILQRNDSLAFGAPLLDTAGATAAARRLRPEAHVSQSTLVRHKPGRRALIRWTVDEGGHTTAWMVKIRMKGTDTRSAALQRALTDAGLTPNRTDAIAVPPIIGILEPYRAVVQQEVPGVPLLRAVGDGLSPRQAGRRMAMALSTLHGSGVRPSRTWTVDAELTLLRARLEALQRSRPAFAPALALVWRRLVAVAHPLRRQREYTCAHRDFYHDQLLIDGDRTWIVDVDCAALADPAIDVGNAAAHLIEAAWRGVLDPGAASAAVDALTAEWAPASPSTAPLAVERWTLLSLARLVEIAMHHDDRRSQVASHLTRLHGLLLQPSVPSFGQLLDVPSPELVS